MRSVKVGILLLVVSVFFPTKTQALPYSATSVIGQIDYDSSVSTLTHIESGLNNPGFTALDTVGHHLFVSDSGNSRVLIYDLDSNNSITTNTPSYVLGQANFTDVAPATSQTGLNNPKGLVYNSASSTLFVADSGNNRILMYDMSGLLVTSTPASAVIGQADFDSAVADVTQVNLNVPLGMTYKSASNTLFVADSQNLRVLMFNLNNLLTTSTPASVVIGKTSFIDNFNAPTSQTNLYLVNDVVYDVDDNTLFVADSLNNRVLAYSLNNLYTTSTPAGAVIGQANYTDSVAATTQIGLSYPNGLAYNSVEHTLLISEQGNHRVVIHSLNSLPEFSSSAVDVVGQADYVSSDYLAGADRLYQPYGIVYNSVGNNFYVADTSNSRVLLFDAHVGGSKTAQGILGQINYFNKDINNKYPINTTLELPQYVEVDSVNHRLFVSDRYNNRVLIYNLNSNNTVTDTIPDYVLGQPDFTSRGEVTSQTSLGRPFGLAYNSASNTLFVADQRNNRVMMYELDNLLVTSTPASAVIGQADFVGRVSTASQTGLYYPVGVEYDSSDNSLFVSDANNNRVLKYDLNNLLTTSTPAVAVIGQANYTDSGANNTQTNFYLPKEMAYDSVDNSLFVADGFNNRVLKFDLNSLPEFGASAVAVLGQGDYVGNTPSVSQSRLNSPSGVYFDQPNNALFVSDTSNSRVVVYNLNNLSQYPTGMTASDVFGQADFSSNTNGTSQTSLHFSVGVFYNNTSNTLFVADETNNRVLTFDQAINFLSFQTTSSLNDGFTNIAYSKILSVTNSQGVVTYSVVGGALPSGLTLDANTGEISGTPDTVSSYSFTVQATDVNGSDNFYAFKDFTINIYSDYPNNPLNPVVTDVSTSTAVITWDGNSNSNSTVYRVSGDNSFTSVTTTANTVSLSGLTPDTAYTFTVQAQDLYGGYGNSVTTTASSTFSIVPTDVAVAINSATQIIVSWSGTSTAFNVSKDGVGAGWAAGNSKVFSDLTCATSYVFKVQAKNADGVTTTYSSEVSGTTSACPVAASGGGGFVPQVQPSVSNSAAAITIVSNLNKDTNAVSLNFSVDNASQMAISEDPNFSGISWEPYTNNKIFNLSKGDGEKVLYIKFRSSGGGTTGVYTKTIDAKATSNTTPKVVSNAVVPVTNNLSSAINIPAVNKLIYKTGEVIKFKYSYTNNTNATQKIKVIRQLLDSNGKVLSSSVGTENLKKGKTFVRTPSQNVGSKLTNGVYTILVRITDNKNNVIDENSFDITVKKPVPTVKKPVIKKK